MTDNVYAYGITVGEWAHWLSSYIVIQLSPCVTLQRSVLVVNVSVTKVSVNTLAATNNMYHTHVHVPAHLQTSHG